MCYEEEKEQRKKDIKNSRHNEFLNQIRCSQSIRSEPSEMVHEDLSELLYRIFEKGDKEDEKIKNIQKTKTIS